LGPAIVGVRKKVKEPLEAAQATWSLRSKNGKGPSEKDAVDVFAKTLSKQRNTSWREKRGSPSGEPASVPYVQEGRRGGGCGEAQEGVKKKSRTQTRSRRMTSAKMEKLTAG